MSSKFSAIPPDSAKYRNMRMRIAVLAGACQRNQRYLSAGSEKRPLRRSALVRLGQTVVESQVDYGELGRLHDHVFVEELA